MYVIAKVRLAKPVKAIQTKTGVPMSKSFGFEDINGENGLAVGLAGFSNLDGELKKYKQGAVIRVSGTFNENGYTDKNGAYVNDYQIVIDGLAGIKSAQGQQAWPKGYEKPQPHPNYTGGIQYDEVPNF